MKKQKYLPKRRAPKRKSRNPRATRRAAKPKEISTEEHERILHEQYLDRLHSMNG